MADDDERAGMQRPDRGGVRSGVAIVKDIDSPWGSDVFELLAAPAPPSEPTFSLVIDEAAVYEDDPLEQRAPRKLFSRVTWAWIRDVVGYSWRRATGRLRVVTPHVTWQLEGVQVYGHALDAEEAT